VSHSGYRRSFEFDGIKVAGEGKGNPTLRRRELGFVLRQLRTERGLSVDEVTTRLLFSPTKLSRLETGRSGVSPRDIRDLCDLYQVEDPAERQQLIALAREGKQRGWWQEYALPYATYVGLEAEAASISEYNSDLVAGLLQVEDYARAIVQAAADPPPDDATIEQRVEARIKRQVLLTQDDGPLYHCILDEGALRRPVGGPAVMQAQLARIIELARLPRVTFQLIPLDVGAHPGLESTFVILDFEEPMVNDVVYVEGLVGNLYLEGPADLERYRRVLSRLRSIALSPEDSIAAVRRIAAVYIDA
jgi:transcriptional regulator with XRE-family HTH domain